MFQDFGASSLNFTIANATGFQSVLSPAFRAELRATASATFPGRECWRTRPQGPGTILLDRIAEDLGRNTESPRRRAPKRLKSSTQEEKALRNRTPPAPNRLSREALQILVSSSTSANLPKQKSPVREPNRPNTPA